MERSTLRLSTYFLQKAGLQTLPLLVVFIAILHAFLAITATMEKSPTFDEPAHLTAGYSF